MLSTTPPPLLCQTTNLLIANGRFFEDGDLGEFTCVTHNGSSLVDYVLADKIDTQCLSNFKIIDFNEFSDHAPVSISFITGKTENTAANRESHTSKIEYDDSKTDIFRTQPMNNNETLRQLTENINSGPVDRIVESFTNYIPHFRCLVRLSTDVKTIIHPFSKINGSRQIAYHQQESLNMLEMYI